MEEEESLGKDRSFPEGAGMGSACELRWLSKESSAGGGGSLAGAVEATWGVITLAQGEFTNPGEEGDIERLRR